MMDIPNRGPNSVTNTGPSPPAAHVSVDVLLPTPPRREDGGVPVTWPHRTGWHTDQSYRRPPPDVSLFYAAKPCPPTSDGIPQGQTLYCDATAAYEALPAATKARIEDVELIHRAPLQHPLEGADDVLAERRRRECKEPPAPDAVPVPDNRPVRQRLVRVHPETGRKALYMRPVNDLDSDTGPVVGCAPPVPTCFGSSASCKV